MLGGARVEKIVRKSVQIVVGCSWGLRYDARMVPIVFTCILTRVFSLPGQYVLPAHGKHRQQGSEFRQD